MYAKNQAGGKVDNSFRVVVAHVPQVVAAVVDLLVVLGVNVPAGLEAAIVGVVGVAALVYLVVSGRRKVTPTSRPRDANGTPLVRTDARRM